LKTHSYDVELSNNSVKVGSIPIEENDKVKTIFRDFFISVQGGIIKYYLRKIKKRIFK
jgi:hypothetical protein